MKSSLINTKAVEMKNPFAVKRCLYFKTQRWVGNQMIYNMLWMAGSLQFF